jgi:hypothetical protein
MVATTVYKYSVVSGRLAFIKRRNCSLPGVKPWQAGVPAPHELSQICHIPNGAIKILGFDAVCPDATAHSRIMHSVTPIQLIQRRFPARLLVAVNIAVLLMALVADNFTLSPIVNAFGPN